MDICDKIVDAVKAELKMPNLKVKLQPVTSATRIPLMANGTIDLECGSTTNNVEREKQVDFAITYFVIDIPLRVQEIGPYGQDRRPQGQDRRVDRRHDQHQAAQRAQRRAATSA